MSRYLVAAIMSPVIAFSAATASASNLCDRLEARLNQMPEIIGAGSAASMKSESIYRLNLIERAIRHDLRRLRCPTNSVIMWNSDHEEACSRLGEELAGVVQRKQSFQDIEPVLSQHVDDGTGTLPAILAEMRKARCNSPEVAQMQAISHDGNDMDAENAVYSGDGFYLDGQSPFPYEQGDTGDNAGVTTSEADTVDEDGQPADYGMIEVRPGELRGGKSVTSVELPKLENSGVVAAPSPQAPVEQQASVPSVPIRDYDPQAANVRKVGPTFLADDDTIDLRHPADSGDWN